MSEIGQRIAKLPPEQRALLKKRLADEAAAAPTAEREPIAIVGAACRLPGGVNDLEAFWRIIDLEALLADVKRLSADEARRSLVEGD
jgi:hypothetical protein